MDGRTNGRTWKQYIPPQTQFAGGKITKLLKVVSFLEILLVYSYMYKVTSCVNSENPEKNNAELRPTWWKRLCGSN